MFNIFKRIQKVFKKARKLDTLLEHIQMLIYMKDNNGKYLLGSKHAKDFALTGCDNYAKIKIDEHDAQLLISSDDDWVLLGNTITKEKPILDETHQKHYYRILKTPIMNGNEITGLITILRNIDAEKQLQLQKELFVATLSHDLKNPLLAQKQIVEYLIENNTQDENIMKALLNSQNFVLNLLETLLITYKIDSDQLCIKREHFNIRDIIIKALSEFEILIDSKNLDINIMGEDVEVNADLMLFTRVFHNIIANAINFGRKDTKISIFIEPNRVGIQNDSVYINETLRETMFEKYVTGSKHHEKANVGLGLYLSKQVIEAHGENIWLESDGTLNTFWVSLNTIKVRQQ
jgi:signal transduction histidine kinase